MAKYNFAVYYDNNGERKKIYPNDLHNIEIRAFARSTFLLNDSEEIRLYARYRKDSPHFYSLQEGTRTVIRGEDNDQHNNRIKELIEILTESSNTFDIGYFTFEEDGTRQFNPLATLKNYTWGKEVNRYISSSSICRHDIFGQRQELAQSSLFPSVGIEVIKSHYPDDAAFDGWISLSQITPLLVTFDIVDKKNYFLKIDPSNKQIRVIYYIFDGSVWKNDTRCTDIISAGAFREVLRS